MQRSEKTKGRAITGFGVCLLMVLTFALFFYFNFRTVVVSGVSMSPTLGNGQRVLVSSAYWLVGPIRRKDIVVVRDEGPTGYMIKRVYRLPGESVDWLNSPDEHSLLAENEFTVPNGKLYVLGDNRSSSDDSRRIGPVNMDQVIGKVVVRP
jgi:signal peptidase I